MKNILVILLALVSFSAFGQLAVPSNGPFKLAENQYYYEFTIPASHYITGYTNASGITYSVDINKDAPCNVVWYVDMDSVKSSSGTDSMNVDVKQNYKIFTDQSYTTLKTIAVDLDQNGDYGAAVLDSSYIIPTGSGTAGNKNISLTRPEFGRIHQLSITPTSGPGVGKVNDRVKVVKVAIKIYKR